MFRVKYHRGVDAPIKLPEGLNRTVRWCIPHCKEKPYKRFPQPPVCMGHRSEMQLRPGYTILTDPAAKKQISWANDGLADVRDGSGPHMGNALYARHQLLGCEAHFRGAIECWRRKATRAQPNMTRAMWEELLRRIPIERVFKSKKCSRDRSLGRPKGSIWFAVDGMRRDRRARRRMLRGRR
jgi:hypothetical protein